MDTTYIEYTAEDLIAHKLQRGGLLVAKPKFDRDGTDLIALMVIEPNKGVNFMAFEIKLRKTVFTILISQKAVYLTDKSFFIVMFFALDVSSNSNITSSTMFFKL